MMASKFYKKNDDFETDLERQQKQMLDDKEKAQDSNDGKVVKRNTKIVQFETRELFKITLRLDPSLADALKIQAKKEARSLNTLIGIAIKEYLLK